MYKYLRNSCVRKPCLRTSGCQVAPQFLQPMSCTRHLLKRRREWSLIPPCAEQCTTPLPRLGSLALVVHDIDTLFVLLLSRILESALTLLLCPQLTAAELVRISTAAEVIEAELGQSCCRCCCCCCCCTFGPSNMSGSGSKGLCRSSWKSAPCVSNHFGFPNSAVYDISASSSFLRIVKLLSECFCKQDSRPLPFKTKTGKTLHLIFDSTRGRSSSAIPFKALNSQHILRPS